MMIIGNSFLFGFCQIYSVNIPLYILLYSQILFYFPVLFFIFDAIKPLRIHKNRKRQEDARHIVMTILIIIAVVVVIFIAIYNSLVRKRNETENAFAAIDVMLKKRYDLIPNLVTTVKEYAEHEKSTFAQITEMRNKSYASFSNQDKENLDSAFSQACTHFFAIAENYPQLKASENFEQLQRALTKLKSSFRQHAELLTLASLTIIMQYRLSRQICWPVCLVSPAKAYSPFPNRNVLFRM